MADIVDLNEEAEKKRNEAEQVRMGTILETNAAVEKVRQAYDEPTESGRPRPEWIRGVCPQCGDDLVANCYYVGGRGYLITRECWSGLGENPTCSYRKIL